MVDIIPFGFIHKKVGPAIKTKRWGDGGTGR